MHPTIGNTFAVLRSTRRHPQIKTLNFHRAKVPAVIGVALVAAATIFVAQRKLNSVGESENRSPATADAYLNLHRTSGKDGQNPSANLPPDRDVNVLHLIGARAAAVITNDGSVHRTVNKGKNATRVDRLGDVPQNASAQWPVVLADKRPDLAISFNQSARLKLASRKNEYRIGDLISLDAALINISEEKIFLRKLRTIRFYAHDTLGEEIDFEKYIYINTDISPDSFQLVRPGETILHTANFLVGCNKQALESIGAMVDAKDGEARLDENLFVTWGEGCLDVKGPGTYVLFAKHSNDYVMVPAGSRSFRTASGSVKSPLFTILVRE